MARILVIRHAEKPTPDDAVRGVDPSGRPDPQELSVLGWQRAGALAALLGDEADARRLGLETPRHLFAPRPTPATPSARSASTVQPLADALHLPICVEFAVGEEAALVGAVLALRDCVLVCWQHEGIAAIARELAGSNPEVPRSWPEDRYDLIWDFRGEKGNFSFRQVPQLLLAGDQARPIAAGSAGASP